MGQRGGRSKVHGVTVETAALARRSSDDGGVVDGNGG